MIQFPLFGWVLKAQIEILYINMYNSPMSLTRKSLQLVHCFSSIRTPLFFRIIFLSHFSSFQKWILIYCFFSFEYIWTHACINNILLENKWTFWMINVALGEQQKHRLEKALKILHKLRIYRIVRKLRSNGLFRVSKWAVKFYFSPSQALLDPKWYNCPPKPWKKFCGVPK